MRNNCVRASLLLMIISFAQSLPTAIHAETAGGIVMSPPFQQITIGKSSGTAFFSVTLTNRTTQNQTLTASTVDFKSLDESGGVAFLGSEISELERKYGLAKWLKLETAPVMIPAGESKKIVVTVDNRPDLSPGGHYGAVVFKAEGGSSADAPNSVAVKQVMASLVFARKLGGEHYDLLLSDVMAPKNWASGSQRIKLRFYNPGNVHVVPRGIVSLVDSKGKVLSKSIVNPESGILLPESYRVYPVTLSDVPALKPGTYKLVVNYRYDGITNFAIYTKQIRIFDWRFAAFFGGVGLAIALLVAAVLKFGVTRLVRRRKKDRPKPHAAF